MMSYPPSQIRVLEDKLGIEAIDRTMLILDIFARRARTREAKLQVEVARLQYMLPRLVGRKMYDQQGGGQALPTGVLVKPAWNWTGEKLRIG